MSGISISLTQLLIIGIPQGFLIVLALYILTRTKINLGKYLSLSVVFTLTTYLVRFLPISIGVNSMLSFLVLILIFLIVYKLDLIKIINLIINTLVILLVVCISEIVNAFSLKLFFGITQKTLNESTPLLKSICMIPSNVMLVLFVLISHLVIKNYLKKEKEDNGDSGKKTGE